MRFVLVLLLLSLLPASAQTQSDYQRDAVKLYPDLAVDGSPLNSVFQKAYTEKRKTDTAFFSDPKWPLTLATQCAGLLGIQPKALATPTPETPTETAAATAAIAADLAPLPFPIPRAADAGSCPASQSRADWCMSREGRPTVQDFLILFGTVASASGIASADRSIPIFDGITFLMPAKDAVAALRLKDLPPRVALNSPCFPRGSLYSYSFNGSFDGQYNRLELVVDRADQVLCVQFTADGPEPHPLTSRHQKQWHAYDFINGRAKGIQSMEIEHALRYFQKGRWRPVKLQEGSGQGAEAMLFKLDTALWREVPVTQRRSEHKCTAVFRLYIPRPLVEYAFRQIEALGGK